MKVLLVLAVSLVVALAESPRPAARLILLPRVSPAAPPQAPAKPEDSKLAKVLDSGEYYVLTPEGKLQMVKYTTAALQEQPAQQPQQTAQFAQQPQQTAQFAQQPQQTAQFAQQPQPFAQFQVGYLQYPGYQQSAAPRQEKEEYNKPKNAEAADYEAKVEFRDVKPIPAPIYAYNPDPLVRILKK